MTGRLLGDSTAALLRRRQALVKQLARVEPLILRGSLIERYKRCGNLGCVSLRAKPARELRVRITHL